MAPFFSNPSDPFHSISVHFFHPNALPPSHFLPFSTPLPLSLPPRLRLGSGPSNRSGEKESRAHHSGQAHHTRKTQSETGGLAGKGLGWRKGEIVEPFSTLYGRHTPRKKGVSQNAEGGTYGVDSNGGAETLDPWGWIRGSYLSIPLSTPPRRECRAAWPPVQGRGCAAARDFLALGGCDRECDCRPAETNQILRQRGV